MQDYYIFVHNGKIIRGVALSGDSDAESYCWNIARKGKMTIACYKLFSISEYVPDVSLSKLLAAEQRDEADGELAGKAPKSLSTEDK